MSGAALADALRALPAAAASAWCDAVQAHGPAEGLGGGRWLRGQLPSAADDPTAGDRAALVYVLPARRPAFQPGTRSQITISAPIGPVAGSAGGAVDADEADDGRWLRRGGLRLAALFGAAAALAQAAAIGRLSSGRDLAIAIEVVGEGAAGPPQDGSTAAAASAELAAVLARTALALGATPGVVAAAGPRALALAGVAQPASAALTLELRGPAPARRVVELLAGELSAGRRRDGGSAAQAMARALALLGGGELVAVLPGWALDAAGPAPPAAFADALVRQSLQLLALHGSDAGQSAHCQLALHVGASLADTFGSASCCAQALASRLTMAARASGHELCADVMGGARGRFTPATGPLPALALASLAALAVAPVSLLPGLQLPAVDDWAARQGEAPWLGVEPSLLGGGTAAWWRGEDAVGAGRLPFAEQAWLALLERLLVEG